MTTCQTCGSPVRVEGKTTMHYVPVDLENDERTWGELLPIMIEELRLAREVIKIVRQWKGYWLKNGAAFEAAIAAYDAACSPASDEEGK